MRCQPTHRAQVARSVAAAVIATLGQLPRSRGFFGTLKSECVWQHRFQDRDDAFAAIAKWMDRYHAERPHSALGYLTPVEYRETLAA